MGVVELTFVNLSSAPLWRTHSDYILNKLCSEQESNCIRLDAVLGSDLGSW